MIDVIWPIAAPFSMLDRMPSEMVDLNGANRLPKVPRSTDRLTCTITSTPFKSNAATSWSEQMYTSTDGTNDWLRRTVWPQSSKADDTAAASSLSWHIIATDLFPWASFNLPAYQGKWLVIPSRPVNFVSFGSRGCGSQNPPRIWSKIRSSLGSILVTRPAKKAAFKSSSITSKMLSTHFTNSLRLCVYFLDVTMSCMGS